MPYSYFSVPALNPDQEQHRLNQFVQQHRMVRVENYFVPDGCNSYWAVCVHWLAGEKPDSRSQPKVKIDYKESLSEQDFLIFATLRTARNKLAESVGVPAYVIFTNAQLAEIATNQYQTLQEVASIEGVSKKTIEKYGASIELMLSETYAQQVQKESN